VNTQDKTQEDEKQTTSGDNEESSYDSDLVAKSLGKVGKGAGVLFIGTALGLLFGFLKRVLIARFYTPADYGLFNLYFTILSMFAAVGAIGLRNGIQRNIAYYLGKDEKNKVPAIIGWGLAIGLASGIVFGIALFLFANPLASIFSDDPILGFYFRIAAVALPFYILTIALMSVFRGFQRTKERILFYRMGRNGLFVVFIIIIGLLALPFENVILSISFGIILISIIFFIYYLKTKKKLLGLKKSFKWDFPIGKKLLLFSLPLLFVDLMYRIMGWADTMMIGYFLREDFVGYYQAARPLTGLISTALTVTLFIYSPIASSLYGQEKIKENEVIFTTITKWICFGSLPIALVFIFYPKWVISFLFGADYLAAVIPLQILAAVYFVNNLMGPNGATLTAYGKTKFLMYATGAATGLNLILNGALIPYFGIIGAATATGISLISINIIRVKKLKSLSGIHPVRTDILKPLLLSIPINFFLVLIIREFLPINIIIVAISGVSFYGIFLLSMIFTKSFSKNDIKVLLLVEKKLGIDLSNIKKILRRFI